MARIRALAVAIAITSAPLAGAAESPSDAAAVPGREDASDPPPSTGTPLTGKERLSGKASDQQRVNDCGVPPDERGPEPRPASCDHQEAGKR